jgi:nitrate/TMAO reductase-like tetraheme cytochrome c subunit
VTRLAALARHPVAILGAIIATASGIGFVVLATASLSGLFPNPYAGLVVFVAFPAVFILGLLLMPLGMWLEKRRRANDPSAGVQDWPVLDFRIHRVRRAAFLIAALTAVNVIIVLLAGYGSLHSMESAQFCGTVCHTVMQPQFMAWQGASHAKTACVNCHIGEGPRAFVRAKLAGVRQLVHVAAGSYERPTPPGADMPAGAQAETCRSCHQPERTTGDRVRVIREYADDEENSETATVLQMHLGRSASGRSVHWHADPSVRVEYIAMDATNETIPYVKVTDSKGVREFVAADTPDELIKTGTRKTMDCIDCHNAVGHPIAPTAEQAVDRAIAAGLVSKSLPHARREGVRLMKASYSSEDEAARVIDQGFRGFYKSRSGPVDEQAVAQTVAALQALYRRNVFPAMNVTFGSYPDNRGHITSTGCFRCHDDSHMDKSGATISADCEYCHKQSDAP